MAKAKKVSADAMRESIDFTKPRGNSYTPLNHGSDSFSAPQNFGGSSNIAGTVGTLDGKRNGYQKQDQWKEDLRNAYDTAAQRQIEASDRSYDQAKGNADRQATSRGMGRSSYNNATLAGLDSDKAKAQNAIRENSNAAYQQAVLNQQNTQAQLDFQQQQAAQEQSNWQAQYNAAQAQQAWQNAFNESQAAQSQANWQQEYLLNQQQVQAGVGLTNAQAAYYNAQAAAQNAALAGGGASGGGGGGSYNPGGNGGGGNPLINAVGGAANAVGNGLAGWLSNLFQGGSGGTGATSGTGTTSGTGSASGNTPRPGYNPVTAQTKGYRKNLLTK